MNDIIEFPTGKKNAPTDNDKPENGFKSDDVSPDDHLEMAKGNCDKGVLVLGLNDTDFFVTSSFDPGKAILLMERLKAHLLKEY